MNLRILYSLLFDSAREKRQRRNAARRKKDTDQIPFDEKHRGIEKRNPMPGGSKGKYIHQSLKQNIYDSQEDSH